MLQGRFSSKKINKTFWGIKNVRVIDDNFIIYGKIKIEHNLALAQTPKWAENCGLIFNEKKAKLI